MRPWIVVRGSWFDRVHRALRDPDAVVFWGVLVLAGVAIANGWI